jgi:pimeloyl-ACP methyl ester carboxylesterase
MTTSYLERDNGRIAYDVRGDGPLVVCVPGMGELRQAFRFLVPDLVAAGYRVATMDLRGHGDSSDGFDSYDDVAAGTDALALIRHLGGPALVVGSSMGAGAAVWASVEAPDAITGLVLIGPFVRGGPSGLSALMFRLMLRRPWGPAAVHAYYRKFFPGRLPDDFEEHRAAIRRSLRRGDHWRSFVRTTRGAHNESAARIGDVRVPALVVMGDRDPDWPDPVAEARWVASAVGDGSRSELLVVPSAGHYPMTEYPEVVGPAVVAFAVSVDARA